MRKSLLLAIALIATGTFAPTATADDFAVQNLELCKDAQDVNCIVSVQATFADGTVKSAKLTGLHSEAKCSGINGLSHSCTFNEWQVPGLRNEDGSDLIQTVGWIQPPSVSTNSQLPPGGLLFFVSSSGWRAQKQINSPKCADIRYRCNAAYDLQQDVTWKVTVRENSMVPAYTTGTLNEGTVLTSNSSGVWTISYIGKPGITAGILASPVAVVETVPDAADWSQQLWSIRTIDTAESSGLGVHGVDCHGANPSLMTDALWVGLPTFQPSTKEVTLDVNNPHFEANGNVATGHFQAYFSKDFTACYWGMSPKAAAGQAQISITEDNGSSQVALLVTKADANGLTVSASGFHYSKPRISIRLSDQSIQQPVSIAKVKQVKTLTCVKGKVIKKISGQAPKCPTGFKAK